jgi:glutamate carboxypeptidase
MKAGIVMALSALKAIRDLNRTIRRPVRLFLDSCEETGSRAAKETCRKLARGAAAVLCLEPAIPGGALKLERKGRLVVELLCRGRSAHAGSPEQGVSAVEELVRQLTALKRLAKGGITVNPGLVSGGDAVNVVAKEASVWLDIRFRSQTQEGRISDWFETLEPVLPGARVSRTVHGRTPPMEASAASRSLFRRVRAKAGDMGMELTWARTGGGSDASLISDLGIPILDGLGPDGKGIHAEDEHVLISSLVDRTALLTEILLSF